MIQSLRRPERVTRLVQQQFGVRKWVSTVGGAATSGSPSNSPQQHQRPLALVMGVANHRSIAWHVAESFLRQDTDVIVTHHLQRPGPLQALNRLVEQANQGQSAQILGLLPCNVQTDLPHLFSQALPDLIAATSTNEAAKLQDNESTYIRPLNAIVHSVAFANLNTPFMAATWDDYATAQHISAYSLLETAQCATRADSLAPNGALVALTYLGATRAVPGYGIMGPAKAALEALVRQLAVELSPRHVHAVSAGPLRTASAFGVPQFRALQRHVAAASPLAVSHQQVADVVTWLASSPAAAALTGQVVYADGGFAVTAGVTPAET
jgi:enoyl-[acyl-carrier protein] reductase I